ncbi:MAG: imelysin family protein [Microscillaceae bacterium]|nr:imelysin family protein [Microscillaceae bacterium]
MKKYTLYLLFFLGLLMPMACGDSTNPIATDFDRASMLNHLANTVIMPRLQSWYNHVETLAEKVLDFEQNPNETTLVAAQTAWQSVARSWQKVSGFGFGPGELSLGAIDQTLGTFPVNEAAIENAIQAQNFSLDNFQRDVRGIFALEYLLFDPTGGNQAVLALYQAQEAEHRRAYLVAVMDNLQSNAETVWQGWASYKATFISNDGTSAGSSVALLFNEFSRNYEGLKNFKVGLPAGKRPGQIQIEPEKVEAYYSQMSRELLLLQFEALVAFWEGKGESGENGASFKAYLLSVAGGPELITATEAQIALVRQALQSLPSGSFSAALENNLSQVENLHTELQKLTRFFKSDMASLLGIAITFDSGDGD